MNRCLKDLIGLLDLEMLEDNLFRGQSRDLGGKSVYGGQVIGQALVAAGRTVADGALSHSLHAYFLRPGDMEKPIVYEVDRVRDGRSFTTRRVQAIQHGQPILSLIASFQRDEPGLEHQAPMPQVLPPEALRSTREMNPEWLAQIEAPTERMRMTFTQDSAIEIKPVKPRSPVVAKTDPPEQAIWFRADGRLPDRDGAMDRALHRSVLAYASDFNLLSTALRPHAKAWLSQDMILASIDHAVWFHRDARVDEWLLYVMDSPSAQGARGLSRGLVYTRDGLLVASMVQENLMREVRGGRA